MQKLIDRVKQILLNPKGAGKSLQADETTTYKIYQEYLSILGIIPAIATFLGWWGAYRSFGKSLIIALVFYGFVLFGVWLTSFVSNFIGPFFGTEKTKIEWFKISVISWTPYFVACILNVLPRISILTLISIFYGIYLFHITSDDLLEVPKEKKVFLTIVFGIFMLVIWYIGRFIYQWGRF